MFNVSGHKVRVTLKATSGRVETVFAGDSTELIDHSRHALGLENTQVSKDGIYKPHYTKRVAIPWNAIEYIDIMDEVEK